MGHHHPTPTDALLPTLSKSKTNREQGSVLESGSNETTATGFYGSPDEPPTSAINTLP